MVRLHHPRKSFCLLHPRKYYGFLLSLRVVSEVFDCPRGKMSLAWAEASYKESWAMVSLRVATVARSAAVAVARFARASTVLDW